MWKKVMLCLCGSVLSSYMLADNLTAVDYKVRPVYGYRADGTPGRIVSVKLRGAVLKGDCSVDVNAGGRKENSHFMLDAKDSTEVEVLLPSTLPVGKKAEVTLTLTYAGEKHKKKLSITPMRHWNIYLYNHSHVDIGYTNTHKNVELLHKNNIIEGIKLAEETKSHPRGAQYVWNPEVSWPLERLWQSNPEKRAELIEAIKKGQLSVDASYLNLNTSICSDEELFHVFKFTRNIQKLSGQPSDVFQQLDIPGISWGLIPVMAQEGVRYIMSWPNSDRAGNAHTGGMDGKPFWWIGPDGKSKVLFLQPGGYANSGSMEKGATTGRPWFGQRDPEKVPLVIKTGAANVDFTGKLIELENSGYPYDFTVLSWTLWDNCPLDADIPFAVKEWNEKYAYPKIIISGGHEIMSMIEEKYGDKLPVVTGDYTEYWTDGIGTAAGLTSKNRNAKERLVQAETVWSLLANGKKAPRHDFDEGWRYILLGSEHTWCFENPTEPYFQDAIWKVKQSYFHEAEDRSINMLAEALAPVTDKSNGALGPKEGPANGGIAVINTHTWPQRGIVTLSESESLKGNKVIGPDGNEVLSQRLSTGELIFAVSEVPGQSSRHYRVVEGDCSLAGGCRIDGTTLDNEYLKLHIDPQTGNIVDFTTKNSDYNYADNGGLNTFSWLPANENRPEADTVISVSVIEKGPLAVELRITSKARGCRSVSRSVRLLANQPWVEITNVVDKLPLVEKDGIHFGFSFNIPDSKTRVDIPWGVMEVEKDQWPQGNRNWLALQRWLDVSNDTHGITWCSLDAPLFEYGDRYANISMGWGGKGNWVTKLEPSSTIYSWVMNNHWHTNFPLTQDGQVTFRYRMLPHTEYDVTEANRFGLEQSQPLLHVTTDKDPGVQPLVAIDNPKVYPSILKSLDEDHALIVRLRSLSDREESVNLSFPKRNPARISICDLEEIAGEQTDGKLRMRPYGQVTLKLDY